MKPLNEPVLIIEDIFIVAPVARREIAVAVVTIGTAKGVGEFIFVVYNKCAQRTIIRAVIQIP